MRIGVIRGDLQGPIHLQDLEVVSQFNPTTEPMGQERYIGRPTTTEIEGVLASAVFGAGATIEGSDLTGTFPITVNAANDDFKLRTSSAASYTTILVGQAVYASVTTLLAAMNVALRGTGVTARLGTGAGICIAIESDTRGVNSYLGIDSVANGSVFNTAVGFGAAAVVRNMPAASAFITACNLVGGALNVSTATINGVGAGNNANALTRIPTARGATTAVADAIAPKFIETIVALDSYLVGMISEYRSANYNPDTRSGLPNGAAISVVQDDGVTPYAPTIPVLNVADLNTPVAGAMTLTGTGLGSYENKDTVVKVVGPGINKSLSQVAIEAVGGTVNPTSIVIPALLLTGATLTTSTARVKVRQRVSAAVALT